MVDQGLKTSLAMFAGDKMDQVIAVEENRLFDFREQGLTADILFLVLADIVGKLLTTAASRRSWKARWSLIPVG